MEFPRDNVSLRAFQEGFRSNPRFFNPNDLVVADPIEDMFMSSSALDAIRRGLPTNVADTAWGNDFQRRMEGAPNWQRKIANAFSSIPLGGMSLENKAEYQAQRFNDPRIARETIQPGQVSSLNRFGLPITNASNISADDTFTALPNKRAKLAQIAGVAGGDIMTDGLRTIWWFLNAPQAVATLASLQGLHWGEHAGDKPVSESMPSINISKDKTVQARLLPTRGYRLAATMPAVIGTSLAIGNVGRQPGYKAVIPSQDDPRKTADPIAETISRYFLGRTGRLLPYSEFVKERPDVSPDEYKRYKAYTFDQRTDLNPLDGDFNILGALKGTVDGIHGPEVNFMGKSIPIATGVVPAAAAAIGTGLGLRRAGRRLVAPKGGVNKIKRIDRKLEDIGNEKYGRLADQMETTEQAQMTAAAVRSKGSKEKSSKWKQEMIDKAQTEQRKLDSLVQRKNELSDLRQARQDANEREAFLSAIKYGSGALAGAAVTGQALESIRRSLKPDYREQT